jgi:spore coat polysaccharide biosynthesis predicted glycosyltransferase SpsG
MADVVIRCDATEHIGYGHLSRSIALAQAFHDDGLDARLAMRPDSAVDLARQVGVRVIDLGSEGDDTLREEVARAQALVLDYREALDPRVIADRGPTVLACIDDPTDRRLHADLVFYPPIPQVHRWTWDGFRGELLTGWDWVILRRDVGEPRPDRVSERPRVLITMGGSDPARFSELVLEAMTDMGAECEATLVIGPANPRAKELTQRAAGINVTAVTAPPDFTALLRRTDFAVASFGVTAYELAALRIPSLFLCLTDDHTESAGVFEGRGIAKIVGVPPHLEAGRIRDAVARAIQDHRDAASWMHQLPRVLDGGGAGRVARRIAAALPARGVRASS